MTTADEGPTPFLQAILLCDDVITDATTGKTTIVGIFNEIKVGRFPTLQQITLFARMTDAQGAYKFRVDYVQVEKDEKLAEGSGAPLKIGDRLETFELTIKPPPVPIPSPGEYELRLWANDRYLGRVLFKAVKGS